MVNTFYLQAFDKQINRFAPSDEGINRSNFAKSVRIFVSAERVVQNEKKKS